jgi:hypothetical protein
MMIMREKQVRIESDGPGKGIVVLGRFHINFNDLGRFHSKSLGT